MFLGYLACIWSVSCAPRPNLRGPTRLSEAYEKELLASTASGHLFNEFDRQVEVHATLFSPYFRRVFREHFQQVFGYPLEEGRGELEKAVLRAGERPAFFLAIDFSDSRWTDLSSPDSVWKVLLEGSGGQRPVSVQSLDAPLPNLRAFFPYLGEFARCFWVMQPKEGDAAGTEPPVLMVLTSAYGKVELSWKGRR